MTETQRKFLTEYLGECWHKDDVCPHCGYYCTGKSVYCCPPIPNRTFTDLKDKQDLLEAIIKKVVSDTALIPDTTKPQS